MYTFHIHDSSFFVYVQLHRALMLSSFVTASASFIIIFVAHANQPVSGLVDLSSPLPLSHFIIGIVVTTAQMTNAALSLCRCKPSHKARWIYNIIHGKVIGYSAIILACRLDNINQSSELDPPYSLMHETEGLTKVTFDYQLSRIRFVSLKVIKIPTNL